MAKEMLINVSEGEECRIALLDDGKLEELYMERTSSTSHVGNIYKGKVTNVEASIQAAFVDFGLGRNGFLHISDLMPTYFGRKGEDIVETVGKKMARRDRPPIQRCLRRGDEIVVQIIKEGIGTKGPTLSTYLSIPGRILVMMPGMASKGVSRKIEDDAERRRLRQILDQLDPPEDCGFIIRTAGVGKTKGEIERDLKYLARLWETIKKRRDTVPAPVELYTEGDLVTRTVRDLFTADVERIVVDSKDVARRVKDVIKLTSPRTKNRVDVYEEPIPLFHKAGIEREIELMYSRHVPLPSGGSLVIDSTEAIVAIDVNSGKFRDHSDAEMTAFKTDMEAADEIARQLRLRDLGGVIICDFIDLRYERHRRDLEQRLHDHLKKDRAKTKMLRMSQFGIIEMTRQRMRPSFKRSVYFDCPHCKGAGLVKTPESMSIDVMRRIAIAVHDQRVQRVELAVCSDVSFYLQNRKRAALAELEDETGKRVMVRADPALGLDEMKLDLFDARDGLVMIDGLAPADGPPHRTQLSSKPQQGRGGRFDGRRQTSEQRRGPGGRDQNRGGRGGRHLEEEEMPDAEERMELAEDGFGDEEERDQQEPRGDERGGDDARRDRRGREHAPAGRANGAPVSPHGGDRGRDDRGRHDGGRQGGGQQRADNRRDENRLPRNDQPRNDQARRDDNRREPLPAGAENRGPRDQENFGNANGGQGGDEQGGRRRRRRRRGRRGRGRGQGAQQGQNGPQQGGQYPQDDRGGPAQAGNYAVGGEHADWAQDDDRGNQYADAGVSGRSEDDRGNEQADDQAAEEFRDDRGQPAQDPRGDFGGGDEPDVTYEPAARGEPAPAQERSPEPAAQRATEQAAEEVAEEPAVEPAGKSRRRGGRGGRGRGKAGAKAAAPAAAKPPKAAPPAAAEDKAGAASKRRRGSRGGRGRGKKAAAEAEPGGADQPSRASSAADTTEPAPSAKRTGSTDRHVLHNEIEETPVMHEPVRRPRSVRDLDHIPEEFD